MKAVIFALLMSLAVGMDFIRKRKAKTYPSQYHQAISAAHRDINAFKEDPTDISLVGMFDARWIDELLKEIEAYLKLKKLFSLPLVHDGGVDEELLENGVLARATIFDQRTKYKLTRAELINVLEHINSFMSIEVDHKGYSEDIWWMQHKNRFRIRALFMETIYGFPLEALTILNQLVSNYEPPYFHTKFRNFAAAIERLKDDLGSLVRTKQYLILLLKALHDLQFISNICFDEDEDHNAGLNFKEHENLGSSSSELSSETVINEEMVTFCLHSATKFYIRYMSVNGLRFREEIRDQHLIWEPLFFNLLVGETFTSISIFIDTFLQSPRNL